MATPEQIQTQLTEIVKATSSFRPDATEGELHQLSLKLAVLDNDLREGLQLATADEMAKIIRTLDEDGDITANDLKLIRSWMLSDAEYYIQMENDFPNWIAELERLFGNLKQLNAGQMSPESMGQASGVVRDALRVISDLEFYRDQQQRIQRFEAATQTITAEDKKQLSRLLIQKLRSDQQ